MLIGAILLVAGLGACSSDSDDPYRVRHDAAFGYAIGMLELRRQTIEEWFETCRTWAVALGDEVTEQEMMDQWIRLAQFVDVIGAGVSAHQEHMILTEDTDEHAAAVAIANNEMVTGMLVDRTEVEGAIRQLDREDLSSRISTLEQSTLESLDMTIASMHAYVAALE